jgi:hypothetical protein
MFSLGIPELKPKLFLKFYYNLSWKFLKSMILLFSEFNHIDGGRGGGGKLLICLLVGLKFPQRARGNKSSRIAQVEEYPPSKKKSKSNK